MLLMPDPTFPEFVPIRPLVDKNCNYYYKYMDCQKFK